MATITETAKVFFEACESGKGWEACSPHCHADATFISQSEPLADVKSLQAYADWMKGLLTFIPNGRYTLKSFATDTERGNVCAYAVFHGTHSADGGPMAPTGKSTNSDYVYCIEFAQGKIKHMTKIWHAGWAMRELGWMG